MVTSGTLALAAMTAGVVGQSQNRARDILLSCIENGQRRNVVAIVTQRDPGAEGALQKIKLQCSSDGKRRHTVLEPLRMQGVESIDDGETLTVYIPSEGVVMRRESPSHDKQEMTVRLELASKNYTFKFEPKTNVAGRVAVCVVALPVHAELETRRYFIDEENGFPLRLETTNRSTTRTVFDTKAVRYPSKMRDSSFKLTTSSDDSTRIDYTRPIDVKTRSEAETRVGFTPFVPRTLPLGFVVQDMQVSQGKTRNTLMMQVTDGLARATVFQWKSDGSKMKTYEDHSTMERNGVRVMVVSDLDEDVRMRLLKAILQQMMSNEIAFRFGVGMAVDPKSRREPSGSSIGLSGIREIESRGFQAKSA